MLGAIKQLAKEFIFPFLAAAGWTIYNFMEAKEVNLELRNVINIFGPSFFLFSWLISQWFRVTKQQRMESGLKDIEVGIKEQVVRLEEKSADLVNYITGGDSACYICGPDVSHNNWSPLLAVHLGKHPLYDVKARIVDIDVAPKIVDGAIVEDESGNREFITALGDLIPGHARGMKQHVELGAGSSRRFNIFFSARNGSFTQILRLKRVDGTWRHALKVIRENEVIHEDVSTEYPRSSDGKIDWDV